MPANDNERIRVTAPRLLAALNEMEQRFGHVGGSQIDAARLAIHEAVGFRAIAGDRVPPVKPIDFTRMDLETRLKAWPAAGPEDGLSSLYVGHLLDEAARELARLRGQINQYAARMA